MAIDVSKKSWLADLVAGELDRYDPVAARLRLPPEVRALDADGVDLEVRARLLVVRSLRRDRFTDGDTDAESFLAPIQGHVALALDLALLSCATFDPARRRAELAAFFAAVAGETELAVAADPSHARGGSSPAVSRAFQRAAAALKRRCYPPGDPVDGLPLYAGTVAIHRRHLARIAMGYRRAGRLEADALRRHVEFASSEGALTLEAIAALPGVGGPFDARRRRIVLQQIGRLGLSASVDEQVRAAVSSPRTARELALATPARIRPFVLEQLLLALLSKVQSEAGTAFVTSFAEACDVGTEQLAAMQVEAAAFHADHRRWFEAFGSSGVPKEWEALGLEWEAIGEQLVERVAAIVTENLEAIATEIRETGELGQLLAKATAGKALTGEEKRKVKAQLIDLAKAVPALAIFAAPGGMLLLPLLAKLLPFNLLPSAWDGKKKSKGKDAI